ncbi:MAG: GC-type dockerin domain-anchored protein [Phycisphaerales bacterium JB064]
MAGQLHWAVSFPGRVDNPLSLWTVTWIPEDFTPRAVRIVAESPGCFGWTPDLGRFTEQTPDPGHATIIVRTDCLADLDGSGELDVFDFIALQNFFADGSPVADLDADGVLTVFDFLVFLNAFDAGCP